MNNDISFKERMLIKYILMTQDYGIYNISDKCMIDLLKNHKEVVKKSLASRDSLSISYQLRVLQFTDKKASRMELFEEFKLFSKEQTEESILGFIDANTIAVGNTGENYVQMQKFNIENLYNVISQKCESNEELEKYLEGIQSEDEFEISKPLFVCLKALRKKGKSTDKLVQFIKEKTIKSFERRDFISEEEKKFILENFESHILNFVDNFLDISKLYDHFAPHTFAGFASYSKTCEKFGKDLFKGDVVGYEQIKNVNTDEFYKLLEAYKQKFPNAHDIVSAEVVLLIYNMVGLDESINFINGKYGDYKLEEFERLLSVHNGVINFESYEVEKYEMPETENVKVEKLLDRFAMVKSEIKKDKQLDEARQRYDDLNLLKKWLIEKAWSIQNQLGPHPNTSQFYRGVGVEKWYEGRSK